MKPTKLVMQAFGAYAEQTEIDFTQFEEKGLFLICGFYFFLGKAHVSFIYRS